MSARKEIWLPSSETKVQVTTDGKVTVWDEMTMTLRPLKPKTGFASEKQK